MKPAMPVFLSPSLSQRERGAESRYASFTLHMKLRALLLAGLCAVAGQAHAGLFDDNEARTKIQQLEVRVSQLTEKLEQSGVRVSQLTEKLEQTSKQQTQSMLDLQTQIETKNAELRKLRGQIEELVHGLQEAGKRQKDFYVDLDTRVRHFETLAATAPPPAASAASAASAAPASPAAPQPDKADDAAAADGPAVENRAYESAYNFFKAGSPQKTITAFQDFLKKFPDSVHVPNVHFQMGRAYFSLKDFKNALASYDLLPSKYPYSGKVQEAMLGVADCQLELKNRVAARHTLKQIIAKYPGSEMADKARKRLASLK